MKSLLFILSILFPLLVMNQTTGTLQGKVFDKNTKEEIPFVNVVIELNGKMLRGASSDINGKYKISEIPPGKYDLRASFIGYTEVLVRGIQINANQTRFFDISLESSSELLDEVVVVDYVRPLIDRDNSVSGGTVTVEEIRKMPNRYAGSSAASIGGTYSRDGESGNTRGARAEATRYYIDGMPVMGSTALPQSATTQQQLVPECTKAKRSNRNSQVMIEVTNESYDLIIENEFKSPTFSPLSTFSIDVDVASYSNIRRYLVDGMLPPRNAVRIEEMINYFDYDYPQPEGELPFSVTTELADCPWNDNLLLHVGIQGKIIDMKDLPPGNLVFLLDVSGSMNYDNKLSLLKKALKLLVSELRKEDRISIVVYAGSSGLVLPSTKGSEKEKIMNVIDNLRAGGSTAGGEGIQLAYKIARKNFMAKGNNRIILATDGDFNVGITDDNELVELIKKERDDGIFLSVLGFGTGNLKDSKMEKLADKGNGNYSYIDNLLEAKKVLVTELGGTLFTIAKDVKIQIEFNPLNVVEYRLIGYENRLMADEDFYNDKKDAGEIGAGQTVTAIYEIITDHKSGELHHPDELRYKAHANTINEYMEELGILKIKYKDPNGNSSKQINEIISNEIESDASNNFLFAAAVAEFGLIIRNSAFIGDGSYNQIIDLAKSSKGDDEEGYRAEFIRIAKLAKKLEVSQQLYDN